MKTFEIIVNILEIVAYGLVAMAAWRFMRSQK